MDQRAGWRVWLVWAAHATGGAVFGAALLATANSGAGLPVPFAALSALAAAASAQWLALRRYRPAISWWRWVALTILGHVGAAVASVVILLVPGLLAVLRMVASPFGTGAVSVVTSIAIGAAAGTASGLATAMVLRRHFTGTGIWVVATAVAGAVKTLPVFAATGPLAASSLPPFAANALAGFGSACITGVAVALLVRRDAWGAAEATRGANAYTP